MKPSLFLCKLKMSSLFSFAVVAPPWHWSAFDQPRPKEVNVAAVVAIVGSALFVAVGVVIGFLLTVAAATLPQQKRRWEAVSLIPTLALPLLPGR
jgi:hypothetical protein